MEAAPSPCLARDHPNGTLGWMSQLCDALEPAAVLSGMMALLTSLWDHRVGTGVEQRLHPAQHPLARCDAAQGSAASTIGQHLSPPGTDAGTQLLAQGAGCGMDGVMLNPLPAISDFIHSFLIIVYPALWTPGMLSTSFQHELSCHSAKDLGPTMGCWWVPFACKE